MPNKLKYIESRQKEVKEVCAKAKSTHKAVKRLAKRLHVSERTIYADLAS